jgi:hypothetical protein
VSLKHAAAASTCNANDTTHCTGAGGEHTGNGRRPAKVQGHVRASTGDRPASSDSDVGGPAGRRDDAE